MKVDGLGQPQDSREWTLTNNLIYPIIWNML